MTIAVTNLVTIGGVAYQDVVKHYEVAGRIDAARSCRLLLEDPTGELAEAAIEGATLSFALRLNAQDLALFTGTIAKASDPTPDEVDLRSFDSFRTLQTTPLTLTLLDATPAEMITELVSKRLSLDASGVESSDLVLDQLPLYRQTVVDAMRFIHRRLKLSRVFFFDGAGVFTWKERDTTADTTHDFEIGYDADKIDWRQRTFRAQPTDISLGDVIGLYDAQGEYHSLLFIGFRHHNDAGYSSMDVEFEVISDE